MKYFVLSFSLVFSQLSHADVYSSYESLANNIIDKLEAGSLSRDALLIKSGRLITMGEDIMRLYAAKERGCKEQYDQFLREHEIMQTSSFDFLHSRYHDAEGLPGAKGGAECYVARSMVAHPYMALALARNGIPSDVDPLLEEFEEVAERAEVLREIINE